MSQPRFRNQCRDNAGPIGSSEGPRFQLRVLARAGSSTLNVSGRSELGSITYSSPRPPSQGGGTGAIAESRAAGAEQPKLVARLIPMAARCAAPPGPTAGSQPVAAGSLVPMAQSLATEVWSAGRSSGSTLCNLPRAVHRSVAEACWIREVAQIHALWARCSLQTGRRRPWRHPAQILPGPHAAVISAQARWRGEVRCSAHY